MIIIRVSMINLKGFATYFASFIIRSFLSSERPQLLPMRADKEINRGREDAQDDAMVIASQTQGVGPTRPLPSLHHHGQ